MKGGRKCRLDHASGEKPSGPIKKYGDRVKNRRGGAPEGARALAKARGRLHQGAQLLPAPFRRSASLRGGKKKPGASPEETRQEGLAIRACGARSGRRAPISIANRKVT